MGGIVLSLQHESNGVIGGFLNGWRLVSPHPSDPSMERGGGGGNRLRRSKKDGRDFAKTKGRGEQSVPKDYPPVILLPSMLRWLGCTGCPKKHVKLFCIRTINIYQFK